MRLYRGADGHPRLWIESEEIERIVEDEIRRSGLALTLEAPPVNLERFIEQHLDCLFEPYADLPQDTLGLTEFETAIRPRIRINRDLTSAFDSEDASLSDRGRWRATLAHEISHVLLHRSLFELSENQLGLALTSTAENAPIICKKVDVSFRGRGGDWREVQANMCMAALLMPRTIFRAAMDVEATSLGLPLPITSAEAKLVDKLARRFEVSRQAARFRLQCFLEAPGQRSLAL